MIQWLRTALDTYALHAEHGNGYQWWSGGGSDLGYAGIIVTLVLKHNCHEHRCPRIGRVQGEDGYSRCKRCDKIAHPQRYARHD